MSDLSAAASAVSGVPYTVCDVNGRPPSALAEFLGEPAVSVTAQRDGQVLRIQGESRRDGEAVLIYEKSDGGLGRDVRTWYVQILDGHFAVTERALF